MYEFAATAPRLVGKLRKLVADVSVTEPPGILDGERALIYTGALEFGNAKQRLSFAQAVIERSPNGLTALDVERELLQLGEHVKGQATASDDGEDEERSGRAPKQSAQCVQLFSGPDMAYFHTPDRQPYVTVAQEDHYVTYALRSGDFELWAKRRYWLETGETLGGSSFSDALPVLCGKAREAAQEDRVWVRVAGDHERLWLDLGDTTWDAIEVDAHGWRIVGQPPVKFRRSDGMLPLPRPTRGGGLADWRPFLHLGDGDDYDEQFLRILAFTLDCYRPGGPYPILGIYGPEGSGKSTVTREIRKLVDPAQIPLRRPPRDERTLFVQAHNNALVVLSNMSALTGTMSDALCALTSGEGLAERRLYSNDGEQAFDVVRPVILNGITEIGTRRDYLDRNITVSLPMIDAPEREQERRFWRAFDAAAPRILGALLDAVAHALKVGPDVPLGALPRLADSAHWSARALTHWDYDPQTVLATFHADSESRHSRVLEAAPVAEALRAFVAAQDGEWAGLVSSLLAELNAARGDKKPSKGWPPDATRLADQLRRIQTALRATGVAVEFEKRTKRGQPVRLTLTDGGLPGDDLPGWETAKPAEETETQLHQLHQMHQPTPGAGSESEAEVESGATPPTPATPDCSDGAGATPTGVAGVADEVAASGPADSGTPAETRPGIGETRDGVADVAGVADLQKQSVEIVSSPAAAPYTLLTSPAEVAAALPALFAADWLGLDCETARADGLSDAEEARARTALDPRRGRLRLVQLATRDQVYLLDAFACDPHTLTEVFTAGPQLIGHNLKFDLQFLAAAGLPMLDGERLFDTQLVSQLLDAGNPPEKGRHTLKGVAARYLDRVLDKTEQTSDWGGGLTEAQLEYAATDAAVLVPLALALGEALTAANLWPVARLELRALPAVAWLEQTGAPFDTSAWCALSDAAVAEQLRLEEALTAESGQRDLLGAGTVNWASPAQVVRLLQARGHAVKRTDEETLCLLADKEPLARLLLNYREATKRAGTYGIAWAQQHVHPVTGRVHANWLQLGSRAGRMSCTAPNLQQVPRTPAYRACFRPTPGRVLVVADYSQIELRIAAQISGDATMRAAYQAGQDLHTTTAAAVRGQDAANVSKADRQLAKALNFGLAYGMGAKRLREHAARDYSVHLSEAEAELFRQQFFTAYPQLRRWQQQHAGEKAAAIQTRTLAGRRRLSVAKFTEQLNTPVQGTGADGMKAALALLWERRAKCPSAAPVLAVHDEVVVEVDAGEAEAARTWLVTAMQDGMQPLLPEVPVVVESAIGADWSAKA